MAGLLGVGHWMSYGLFGLRIFTEREDGPNGLLLGIADGWVRGQGARMTIQKGLLLVAVVFFVLGAIAVAGLPWQALGLALLAGSMWKE